MVSCKNESNISSLTKVFSAFVALLPIEQYYKSPLPLFNLATFMAVLFLFLFIAISAKTKSPLYIDKRLFPINIYVVFITVNVLCTYLLSSLTISEMNLPNYLRTMVLIISVMFFGKTYFDWGYSLKVLETILYISSIYMAFQLFCIYVFHHPLSGNIGFLLTDQRYAGGQIRPSGLYLEPAAYAQSAILYLAFSLFRKREWTKRDVFRTVWIMLGIVFSGSGQGYLFLTLILIMWISYEMLFKTKTKQAVFKGLILVLTLTICFIIVLNTPFGQYALSRVINEESGTGLSSLGGVALAGRTYTNKVFYKLSPTQQLFGVGFGRINTLTGNYYVNTLFYYLMECGYISMVVWSIILLIVYLKGNCSVRVFTLLYILMFCFTGCGRPMMFCYFFMFLLFENENSLSEQAQVKLS